MMTKVQLIQEITAFLLQITLLPIIVRELFQRKKITIIVYHRIQTESFEKHLQYLVKRYSIISLEDFIKAKYQDRMDALPAKSLVITFDDGAKTNCTLRSVIEKYHIPITIFVCSDILGTNRHFWFNYRNKVKTNLKTVPDTERVKLLSQVGYIEKRNYETPEALSKQDVYDLLDSGASIQSHTLTHPVLPMCDDLKAETEITKSRNDLENNFGIKVNCLAYPNGDYLPRDINCCKKAGYLAAVTMDPGFNGIDTDIYKLKRISIPDNASINQLTVRASGIWGFFKQILKPRVLQTRHHRSLSLKTGGEMVKESRTG